MATTTKKRYPSYIDYNTLGSKPLQINIPEPENNSLTFNRLRYENTPFSLSILSKEDMSDVFNSKGKLGGIPDFNISVPKSDTFEQDKDKNANFWKRIYSDPSLALNTLNGLTGLTLAGISSANTRRKINSMSSPTGAAPIPKQYPQRLSVKPQIENIKNTVNANLRTLKNNTASSKTLSARSIAQRQYGLKNLNEVITAAANSNAELAEKSNSRNAELDKLFGKWNTEFTKQGYLTENSKLDSKITNTNKLLSNILRTGQDWVTASEKRKRDKLSEAYLKAYATRHTDVDDFDTYAKLIASGKLARI